METPTAFNKPRISARRLVSEGLKVDCHGKGLCTICTHFLPPYHANFYVLALLVYLAYVGVRKLNKRTVIERPEAEKRMARLLRDLSFRQRQHVFKPTPRRFLMSRFVSCGLVRLGILDVRRLAFCSPPSGDQPGTRPGQAWPSGK
jgi:hypothetical protein